MHNGLDFAAGVAEARQFHHNPGRNPRVREVLDTWGEQIIRCVREGGQLDGTRFEPIPEARPAASERAGATASAAQR